MAWPQGTYLFDSFHPFRASAPVCDAGARTVRLQPTADHGADRSAAAVELADHLDHLADECASERLVNGYGV